MIAAAMTFAIASATFKPNTAMPKTTAYNKGGCIGGNRSPELHWSGAPKGTRSFALIVHDPDAPVRGGWYHWVVYNVPPATSRFGAGAALPDSELGTTSFGEHPYGGPCPPSGTHHYHFTLYALDVASFSAPHLTGPQLQAAISRHTIAKASVIGLYSAR